MEASWIGEGFSQPFSKMPIKSSRFRQKSSKSFPFVSVTSDVFLRQSLGGSFNWDFQSDGLAAAGRPVLLRLENEKILHNQTKHGGTLEINERNLNVVRKTNRSRITVITRGYVVIIEN